MDAPKTWEDFEKIAPKLKKPAIFRSFSRKLTWQFTENIFSRNNIQFGVQQQRYDSIKDTVINVTDPNHVMMYEKLKAWKDQGYFAITVLPGTITRRCSKTAKAALWIGSSGSFGV